MNGGERGSASVELAVLTIPLIILVAFTVFVGRYASTYQEVTSASRDAARAAAVRQSPAQARLDGIQAATRTLEDRSVSCPGPDIGIDTDRLEPGGRVTATVECVVSLADLTGLGIPGSVRISAESISVVDSFRGGDGP